MRKFNLKGTVIQRMRGIEREEPQAVETEKTQIEETPVMSVDFSEEQGVLSCAWRTDVGRLRKNNQDAVILGNGLAGVADGMGGHKGGEIASAGLRDGLLRETKDSEPGKEKLEEVLAQYNEDKPNVTFNLSPSIMKCYLPQNQSQTTLGLTFSVDF